MTCITRVPIRERLFWACLAVYIAVLPMSSTMAVRNIAFAGLIIAAIWKLTRRDARLYFPAFSAWGLYLAVALASLASAIDFRYSLNEIRTEIIYPAIVFAIAASFLGDARRLQTLAWLVAACNAFMLAGSFCLVAITPNPTSTLIGSYRAASGTYATYLVTALPMLLLLAWQARERRVLALAGLLIAGNLGALYFTGNRQGVLAYAAEISVFGAFFLRRHFTWRRAAILAAAVLAVVALFVAQQHKRSGAMSTVGNDVRWALWDYTVSEIAKKPWQGAGFGRQAFRMAHPEQRTHAHNMVLNKGVQMGMPGIAAFLLLWLTLGATVWRAAPRGADPGIVACASALLAGVFLKNMTDDFFVEDCGLMFWLLCGALLGALRLGTANVDAHRSLADQPTGAFWRRM